MSKRKLGPDGLEYIDTPVSSLTEDQIFALQHLHDVELPSQLKCLEPLLERIKDSYESGPIAPHRRPIKTRQATELGPTLQAAEDLGVNYKESLEYAFTLKPEMITERKLSPHFAAVVEELKTSNYIRQRRDESLTRTVLDLILTDRLRRLQDEDAFNQLILSAEVPVQVKIEANNGDEELIKGRADWVLGYGPNTSDTGSILVVVEAKGRDKASVALPQLLVYMVAVYNARGEKQKQNQTVFGMLSDGAEFKFAFLDANKKFHVSRPLAWIFDSPTILAYIDNMLLDAIKSSPHTTPNKKRNDTLLRYPQYLRGQWKFGEEEEEEGDDEVAEDEIVEVVHTNRGVVLRSSNI